MAQPTERRVWIVQCLCPSRHAIAMLMCEAEDEAEALTALAGPLVERLNDWVQKRIINPRCGLCGAKQETWRLEPGRTRWRTMQEAAADPLLGQTIEGNRVARELFGDLHKGRPN